MKAIERQYLNHFIQFAINILNAARAMGDDIYTTKELDILNAARKELSKLV